MPKVEGPPVEAHLPGHVALQPADGLGDLAASGADQSGETEDLAGLHLERDVAEPSALGQAVYRQDHVRGAVFLALFVRILAVEDAADHRIDEFRRRRLGDVARHDVLAVAENRDSVAVVENLRQPVGDVDDRDAAGGEPANDAEERLRLALGQSGGGFVEDQHPAVERQRLGDLDQLLVGDRQVTHQRSRVDVAELAEDVARPPLERA